MINLQKKKFPSMHGTTQIRRDRLPQEGDIFLGCAGGKRNNKRDLFADPDRGREKARRLGEEEQPAKARGGRAKGKQEQGTCLCWLREKTRNRL